MKWSKWLRAVGSDAILVGVGFMVTMTIVMVTEVTMEEFKRL